MTDGDDLQLTSTVDYGRAARRLDEAGLDRGASLGRYVVLDLVGSGGMGVIYSAYDPDLDRRVALKILRAERFAASQAEEARERLLREAKALARLAHPNVVAVHDVGVVGGQVFVAMEFIEGIDLKTWLRQEKRGWREILRLFAQAGKGLAAAHRAGLTHRDFKPANVMLGDDGRVRVLDFGLAIPRDDGAVPAGTGAEDLSGSGSGSRTDRLTRTGRVAGTPAYMAPEQYDDPAVTAACDQFSFCVALWEALYDQLPFAGKERGEVLDNMRAGRLRAVPRNTQAPAWLRKAVARGLAADPADRHPSLEALLTALERKPPRRWLAAALVVVTAAAALGTYLHQRSTQLCQGAEQHLVGIWDTERKAAIRAAVLASPKPYAGGLWQGIERTLDEYTSDWVEMRTEACAATRLRGEQSEQLLDLRMDCLDRRLTELQMLGDLLVEADADAVERSVQAAGKLSSLASCADARALTAVIPPPADEKARQLVADLRADIAEAKALNDLGILDQAQAAAEVIDERLEQIAYPPVEAEAHRLLGLIAQTGEDLELAERHLVLAAAKADQGRHDEVRFYSDIALVWVHRADVEQARRWLELARGALERLGRPPTLLASWHQTAAMIHLRAGEYREAAEAATTAADLSRRHNGPSHRFTVRSLSTLGNALYRQARYPEALATFEEVTAIRLRTLGPTHPDVAYSQQAQGELLKNLGRYEEARELLTTALATLEQALGPDHSRVAITVESLGNTYARLGQLEPALAALRRGLDIWRDLNGEDSSAVAVSLNNIGLVLRDQRQYDEAEGHFRRALSIHEREDGAEHPDTLIARVNLGSVLLDQGRPREALGYLEPAHDAAEQALGAEHVTSVHSGLILGEVLLELGSVRRGTELITTGAALAEQIGAADWLLAIVRFAQARASWAAGDRSASRRRIDEAREIFAAMGSAGEHGLRQIERWQSANAAGG
ncbi:MAG: serine/threonine protein kinase [bacterium]|nr:serine/threonine protein kinase [bacterium]